MSIKTTVILVLILIIISGIYFFDQKKIESVKEEQITARQLLPYSYEEIDSVEFHSALGEEIRWRKNGNGWLITYPVVTEGSGSTIEYILKTIIPGRRRSSFDPHGAFADFGLENPSTYIILYNGIQSRSDTIYFGDKTPMNTQCYVRLGSSPDILLTNDLTRNLMKKSLYHLRNKIFLLEDPDSVRTISFQKGDLSYSFERRGEDWFLSDTDLPADRRLIIPYIGEITESLIYGFEAEDTLHPELFGILSPVRNVTLATPSGPISISFGRDDEKFVYAMRSGLDNIVKLESKLLKIFDWIDEKEMVLKVFFFDPGRAAELVCEYGEKTILIKLGQEGWSISEFPEIRLTREQISQLFAILGALSFESDISSISRARSGKNMIEREKYIIKDRDGELIDEIVVYADLNGKSSASSSKTGAFGTVDRKKSDQIRRYILGLAGSSR
ncbi:MAG: DUF4340 domain-containing protein [Candidatus Krumholzibacteriota bacterium]|nr:DUF4340 domain-containing protein [Candidatus Krumholzibacteriota bacterium]